MEAASSACCTRVWGCRILQLADARFACRLLCSFNLLPLLCRQLGVGPLGCLSLQLAVAGFTYLPPCRFVQRPRLCRTQGLCPPGCLGLRQADVCIASLPICSFMALLAAELGQALLALGPVIQLPVGLIIPMCEPHGLSIWQIYERKPVWSGPCPPGA